MKRNNWFIGFLILTISLLWGYAWIPMKAALDYMGPFTFSAFRFTIGGAGLLLVLIIKRSLIPKKGEWKHFIILGLIQTSVVFLLVMYGLRFVDAGKTAMILYSMPLWSGVFAALLLNERLTKAKGVSLALGMLGLAFILGWDLWTDQSLTVIFGECLIVCGAVAWGLSNAYHQKYLKDANKMQMTAYQMLFGAVGIIIAALIMEWGDPIIFTPQSIYYVLYAGILGSSVCFTLWFVLLTLIDTVTASISILLVPVFSLFFGWLLLDETISVGVLIGSLLIIVGIVTAQRTRNAVEKNIGSYERHAEL